MLVVSRVGGRVSTLYGIGTITNYRQEDDMFEVQLESAMLYTIDPGPSIESTAVAMELNVAYEAFEQMRKLNLELECMAAGIVFTKEAPMDHDMCTKCLLDKGPPKKSSIIWTSLNRNKVPESNTSSSTIASPSLGTRKTDAEEFTNTTPTKFSNQATKSGAKSCLLCGSPTCSKHASPTFRREKIIVCLKCVESLEFDFDNESQDLETVGRRIDHLVDLYDRALLLLKYSSQFMLQVADSLHQSMKHRNHVGVGGSSIGLVSGVLGMAAACTILTPVGPPLLIASLVFGGSATVVQTGAEAMTYISEPNQLADRILALHGMVQSILNTTQRFRETTLDPYLDRAILRLVNPTHHHEIHHWHKACQSDRDAQVQNALTTGARIGSTAATSMAQLGTGLVQEGAAASRFMTRAGTNLALSARFARFAGGALSAATLVLEVRQLSKTVEQIKKGNPCEKADALRTIHSELGRLPSTSTVDAMCQSYRKVKAKQLATKRLLVEQQKLEQFAPEDEFDDLVLVEAVVSSLEVQHEHFRTLEPYVSTTRNILDLSKSSLLERVKRYKELQTSHNAEICLVV